MKKIVPFALAIVSAGCASIFSGTTQEITLKTTPGARYAITDTYGKTVASGETQGSATLERGAGYFSPHAYKARITKPGYQPKTVDIQPGMNPWYFANILLGGIVGMIIVDPITGAMYKFYPSDIEAPLEPVNPDQVSNDASGQLQPVKYAANGLVSRFDYSAAERAKAQGCKISGNPYFDGIKTPAETIIFQCSDGREIKVTCDTQSGCR